MPLRILELGKQFRPATSQIYPPFKNGRYMEEYFYEYVMAHKDTVETDMVYIPIFWTNLQNHPAFSKQKQNYDILLSRAFLFYPQDTKYFTIVQHDDGPQLKLSKNTTIFGACTGNIPLPLIYEDVTNQLLNRSKKQEKELFASFVGTLTHNVRERIVNTVQDTKDIKLVTKPHSDWTSSVSTSAADLFVDLTLNSRFCLAPRGYGRSSFRFFEAMLLDCVPVYFWDDLEWLPYKDILDYSKFSVSIQEKDIDHFYDILKSISNEKYLSMVEELKRVRHYFTLEGMSDYIIKKIL
jgi:uncharacterized protein YozE (UPF0346 family)